MKSIQQKILSHEAIFAADMLVSVAATAVSFDLTNYYSFFELSQRLVSRLTLMMVFLSAISFCIMKGRRGVLSHSKLSDAWRLFVAALLKNVFLILIVLIFSVKGYVVMFGSQLFLFVLLDVLITFVGLLGVRILALKIYDSVSRH
jgi:hypothetical protein